MIGVIDTETTGIEATDEVVEVALVRLDDAGRFVDAFSTLVRPRVPIAIPARAAHHISDADVAGAPTIVEVVLPPFDVVAGHNVEFDLRLLKQSGVDLKQPAIDTYRCARHLYPESPGYSNQVLRYYLEVVVDLEGQVPHRALPDAIVTAAILRRMLSEAPIDHLVDLSTTPVVLGGTVWFGKHRGKRWPDLDSDYLAWVTTTDMDADVIHTAKTILKERREKREAALRAMNAEGNKSESKVD